MLSDCTRDLWEYLQQTNKTIVLYGMGNGADKILNVLAERDIPVAGVFASDGFARGNLFHGMPVRTWNEIKAEFGRENVIVLLSFGTSRPDVLENILCIHNFIPDGSHFFVQNHDSLCRLMETFPKYGWHILFVLIL